MKRRGPKASAARVIALALTWDGARWPVKSLPPRARSFLAGQGRNMPAPAAKKLSILFMDDQVREIRVCWVPCLKGGAEVLSGPFQTLTGKRLAFKDVKTAHFGDVLGVIYRRQC